MKLLVGPMLPQHSLNAALADAVLGSQLVLGRTGLEAGDELGDLLR
jgi:hypothetical protein